MSSAFSTGFPQAMHCSRSSSVEFTEVVSDMGSSSVSPRPRPAPLSERLLAVLRSEGLPGSGEDIPESDRRGRRRGDGGAGVPNGRPSTGISNRAPPGAAAAAAAAWRCSRIPSAAWAAMPRAMALTSALLSVPSTLAPPAATDKGVSHSRRTASARLRAPRSASARPGETNAGRTCNSSGTLSGLLAPDGATLRATPTTALMKRTTAASGLLMCSPRINSCRASSMPNLSLTASCHRSAPSLGIISEGSRPIRASDS
mmetsp:Transcript_78080/g.243162  ORF Transcript_78080/g.243162 Transcript_78080/m.243162 type:complete len:258 (+) Transcript_78080:743-1516(+)